jgi:hypothetical protein
MLLRFLKEVMVKSGQIYISKLSVQVELKMAGDWSGKKMHRTPRINTVLYLYIIRCPDNSLYTGITTDVSRRVKEHNQKTASSYTRARTPVKLVYQEPHPPDHPH